MQYIQTWISHLGLDKSVIYRQLFAVPRCRISNSWPEALKYTQRIRYLR